MSDISRNEDRSSEITEVTSDVVSDMFSELIEVDSEQKAAPKKKKKTKVKKKSAKNDRRKSPEKGELKEASACAEDLKPKITANAMRVLERRYLKKDENNRVCEEPAEMMRRVAHNIASADVLYNPHANVKETEEKFYRIMAALEFVPNSPTLMNAGRDLQQLSACFVLPVDDSMEDIFDTVRNTALIHKSGGGTGFSFSRLRPKNSRVRSTRGASSGPVSFMQVFNAATEVIKQGGTRRGANMGILRIDHPDIMEFIECKKDTKKLNNFNISVGITDKFMKAVKSGSKFDLVDPRNGQTTAELDARKVYRKIIEMAHKNGEPGVVFLDVINKFNPTPHVGEVESTNPCGEQPLLPYESCNLGSINLSCMVKNGEIDYPKLKHVVHASTHFLDNVIDMNRYPIDKIDAMTKANRKIGLGVMGFADMLVQMGISYNSEDAVDTAESVMRFIQVESKKASAELAASRGAFPNFEGSALDIPGVPKVRNATTTTIAPTGTISIISGCSSGVEPYFAVSYVRTVMDKDELAEVNPYFEKIAKERGFYSEELMKRIAKKGTIKDFEEIPQEVRDLFVTSMDITPEDHIRIQAAFQKYTDNAVSKTVNFPADATVDEVEQVYNMAYESGCKGITIYRYGSRDEQVLTFAKEEKSGREKTAAAVDVKTVTAQPRERPSVTFGRTERIRTGCSNLYVTLNSDDNGLCEIFMQMGKAGGCAAAQSEAISRLISLCLRSGIEMEKIRKHLRGIQCHMPTWENGSMIRSCPDALAIVLERHSRWMEADKNAGRSTHTKIERSGKDLLNLVGSCPQCGGPVEHSEGCPKCRICSWSNCT